MSSLTTDCGQPRKKSLPLLPTPQILLVTPVITGYVVIPVLLVLQKLCEKILGQYMCRVAGISEVCF